jgi:hypothetical protein
MHAPTNASSPHRQASFIANQSVHEGFAKVLIDLYVLGECDEIIVPLSRYVSARANAAAAVHVEYYWGTTACACVSLSALMASGRHQKLSSIRRQRCRAALRCRYLHALLACTGRSQAKQPCKPTRSRHVGDCARCAQQPRPRGRDAQE